MSLWIAAFIVGQLLGMVGLIPSQFVTAGLNHSTLFFLLGAISLIALSNILQTFRNLRFVLQGLSIAFGVFQGGTSSAPIPIQPVVAAQIVRTNPFQTGRKPVIAVDTSTIVGQAVYFQVTSECFRGHQGRLTSRATQGLLSRRRAGFKAGLVDNCQTTTDYQFRLKDWVDSRLATAKVPTRDRDLIKGFLWGDERVKFGEWRRIFLRSGVYHLLVTSGLHVTLVAHFGTLICLLVPRLMYIARLVDPGIYRNLVGIVTILAGILACGYASFSGPSAAAQRAALIFATGQLGALFGWSWSLSSRLRTAAFLQTILYPVGFVSIGTLLSWTVYLIVMTRLKQGHWGSTQHRMSHLSSSEAPNGGFASLAKAQIEVTVVTLGVFGQLSIPGLVANLLLIPVFPLILLTAGATIVAPPGLVPTLLEFVRAFADFVKYFSTSCDIANWLCSKSHDWPTHLRLAALLATGVIFLNKSKNLTIG